MRRAAQRHLVCRGGRAAGACSPGCTAATETSATKKNTQKKNGSVVVIVVCSVSARTEQHTDKPTNKQCFCFPFRNCEIVRRHRYAVRHNYLHHNKTQATRALWHL
jgi:hypothetical protein